MSPLATAVLALAIANAPPGRSPYSFEVLAECGTDPETASCPLEPVCADDAPACRPPKWSAARGGWVRMETRASAIRRYATIAHALSDTAERLMKCDRESSCEPVGWGGDARTLALSTLAVALHESGLREDVQFGHPPLGRGPAGEACLVQLGLAHAPRYATWLTPSERDSAASSKRKREAFARTLLADSPAALGRCFEVGMRMLARSRSACGKAGVAWDYGMFSMYGSGRTCKLPGVGESRRATLQKLLFARPELPEDARGLGGEL